MTDKFKGWTMEQYRAWRKAKLNELKQRIEKMVEGHFAGFDLSREKLGNELAPFYYKFETQEAWEDWQAAWNAATKNAAGEEAGNEGGRS